MKNILDYLERTTVCNAWKTAVDDGNICMTWLELQEMSKSIGTALCKRTGRQKPVVILAEKSAVTLAAMFGVVYAGCFYVMVDPKQPIERLCEIFHTLLPEIIIIPAENEALLEQTGYGECKCLLKDIMKEQIDERKLLAVRKACTADDRLYGIFTSGSTGVPKGIVVSHKSVINFITHFIHTFRFTETDVIGNQAPFDFDVSVKDIYSAITTGATLVLVPKRLFALPPKLLDYLCDKKVTVMVWAVSALCLISSLKGLKYKIPEDARLIMFSGEVMPVKQMRLWQQALPQTEFVNLYGPSEITCNCTWYPVQREFQDGEVIPAGKAFNGRTVFLLDDTGAEITEPGKTGEICVAGESLADGYYHNEEETARRFVQGIIASTGETARYYKTGDLGYYGEDENLYFAGRKDFQIKHMGHRIELEEIERAFEKLDGVSRCCCLFDKKRNKLLGFYTGDSEEKEVHQELKRYLPVYMIPAKIRKIDKMPLNKNGKIDRKYLAEEWS